MAKKYLSFLLICLLVTGCQGLAIKEPLITPPEILRTVAFTMPNRVSHNMNSGESFKVVLGLSINENGKVDNIIVKKSSGNQHLDRQALRQARGIEFKAATKDNKFIRSFATLPIIYNRSQN